MQRPRRRGFIGAIAGAALLASLVPAVASAVVGPATQLVWTSQPTTTAHGASIAPVSVSIEDAGNQVVTSSTATVSLAILSNPGGGTLAGTTSVAAVSGVATFSGLSINRSGTGYTLTAASGSLTGATSSARAPSERTDNTASSSSGAVGDEVRRLSMAGGHGTHTLSPRGLREVARAR